MTATAISPSIYLIADHLDAVLALGEDLLAKVPPAMDEVAPADTEQIHQRLVGLRTYLEDVRAIETRLVTRVLRAREHAEQVRRTDNRFKVITDLFVSGTHVVADAAADLVDSTAMDFNTGRDSIAYLRSRGLIGEDIVTAPKTTDLKLSEAFKLVGSIELGALLDLAASYLDTLELHYELYGGEVAVPAGAAASQPAEAPTSP